MPPDTSRFREIAVPPDVLDSWLVVGEPEDVDDEARLRSERLRAELVTVLKELISTRLTARQRQIVELYFFAGHTQQEVAEALGISQQVVSRQLFGVMRDGKKIGGAIKRLRDLCDELGIEWV